METTNGGTNPPVLTITGGGRSYRVATVDAPITVGREFPAQILLDDPRISRAHLRVEIVAGNWVGVDLSRNGVYLDEARRASFPITSPLTVHLGNPDGIPLAFALGSANAAEFDHDDADDNGDDDSAAEPDIARAGAAVAARRAELNLSRRLLARDGIINAGTLNSLEKGKHWPKASTLRKLEEVLGWTPGTISALRQGDQPAAGDTAEATVALTGAIAAAHMAEATNLALQAMRGRIALLPDPADPSFAGSVGEILDELRRLDGLASRVARNAGSVPSVAIALGAIRSTYRELALTAAKSPHATLGQRLYAARYRSGLSEDEAANAAGISKEALTDAEAGQPISASDVTLIETLLAALGETPG